MATSSFADPALASAPPARRLPRRAPIVAAALAVLVAVVAVALALRPSSDPTPARFAAPGKAFSIAVPDGWRALRPAELRAVAGSPAAVIRRADGTGVVIVRRRPALVRSTRSLTRDLTAQIARRFKGVQPVTARTVRLGGGPAYVYTFARPGAGRVQSLVVAPRAGRTYTLDAVTGAGARDVAAQVGGILRSFTTNPGSRS